MDFSKLFGKPRSKQRLISYFFLGLLGLLGAALASQIIYGSQSARLSQKLLPLPQHPRIQVYMNHNGANSYTDPYRKINRLGDNLEQILIDSIKSATSTLDIAVQEIRLPNIVKALTEQKQAGVKVRLIIENSYNLGVKGISDRLNSMSDREKNRYSDLLAFVDINNDGKLSPEEINQRDAITMLKNAGIQYIDDTADGSAGSGLMHHKFTVIDGKTLILTSANYTMSDMHGDYTAPATQGNSNNMLKIRSKEVADLFTEEFNLMWGNDGKTNNRFGTKKPHRKVQYILVDDAQIRIKFSPDKPNLDWEQTSNGVIGTTLSGAEKSVDMALFVFAESKLGNILDVRNEKQVKIRALVDPGFAYREYATTLDMWGYVTSQGCANGKAEPWKTPIKTVGIPSLPKGDLLHHKFGLVDQMTVITGSHNWSSSANFLNDETLIVVQNHTVAAHYDREFERLFDAAILGPNTKVLKQGKKVCPPKKVTGKSRRNLSRKNNLDKSQAPSKKGENTYVPLPESDENGAD